MSGETKESDTSLGIGGPKQTEVRRGSHAFPGHSRIENSSFSFDGLWYRRSAEHHQETVVNPDNRYNQWPIHAVIKYAL